MAGKVSGFAAVTACAAMAVFYVAILYLPVLLRLPPPDSLETFMLRRFACALVSSLLSVLFSSFLLGVADLKDLTSVLNAFGIRTDHAWQAVVYPFLLTSLLYAGSLPVKALWLTCGCKRSRADAGSCLDWARKSACNILLWRNYVVAPITEELVFRACMIPLLLCGGFRSYSIIFFSPIFFSLAHLNHFVELYYQQKNSFSKAFLIVGLQLGYTVVFGCYASLLFIRTGNLIAPVVAHIFCNMMGLPVLSSSQTKGMATVAFAVGMVGFFKLLFPATTPELYNEKTDYCNCWNGYCNWN